MVFYWAMLEGDAQYRAKAGSLTFAQVQDPDQVYVFLKAALSWIPSLALLGTGL